MVRSFAQFSPLTDEILALMIWEEVVDSISGLVQSTDFMRWRGPKKIKPSLSSLSSNNSHAYLFIIRSTTFKTEIIKCDTIFLFFLYCICYITKFPPFLPLIIQYSFIKQRYRIPLFVEKFPDLNISNIKQPTMFLFVLIYIRGGMSGLLSSYH